MKLYHGTTERVGRQALTGGLLPRRITKSSNWGHSSPSHPNGVYLTDAYALYFAIQAANSTRIPATASVCLAVVEIETDRLSPFQLTLDEDTLEQVGRVGDELPKRWTMRQRTLYYRNRLPEYADGEKWLMGVRNAGTACHLGPIPPRAVTRVALINLRDQAALLCAAMQPVICVANYRYCAERYRQLTAQAFAGGPGIQIMENEE